LYAQTHSFNLNELDQLLSRNGGTSVIRAHRQVKDKKWQAETGFDRWFLIKLDGSTSVEEAIKSFQANRYIEAAIPEYYAYTTAVPNDTYYANNWGHNNTAQLPVYTGGSHSGAGVGTIGYDADMQLAWDQSQGYGSATTIIAIIDTGVDTAHPDLRLVAGYDYGDNDANPMDDSADPGHGTACSGVAAGRANNGLGVTGVAGGCSVMPLKIADTNGDMLFTYIENAITHAADNGADVISMSLGAEGGTGEGDIPSTDATLEYAYNAGVVIFAATANSNTSAIAYPSNHNKVISVGASSPTGQRKSTTSSDGENWWGSNYGTAVQDATLAVDIMAPTILPATDITGTGNGYNTSSDYYMWFNGTSCATPYAAGVAALLISKDPTLTPAQVRQAMVSTCTDMTVDGGAGWDRYTGYGMVNANAALNSLVPGMPSCTITAPLNGTVIDLNSTVTVNVTATDTDGTISNVKFYIDDVLKNTDRASPYSWSWNTTGYSAGSHTIKAVATDNSSNTATSTITVNLLAPANEGFETGNFSAQPWTNNSAIPWTIQNSEKYSGNYAAKSGAIGNSASSELSLTLNLSSSGNISFFQRVSSESGYDYLRFYLDNVQQGEWSGPGSWTQQSYPVSSGLHTFKWIYSKDGSAVDGSDCAWIDHLNFPTPAAYYPPPQNLSAAGGNQTVVLTWSAPAGGTPTGYKIFKNGSLLTTVSGTSYNDNAVVNGTSYSYYLKAVYSGGESEATATVNATPNIITSVVIGSGTSSTATTGASPINVYYQSLHGQAVYTAAELTAAGLTGPIDITQLGFNITGLPTLAMPNFVVRMKHTTATNVASWVDNTNLTTVFTSASYQPTATGWNMYTLSTPFTWNGTDNILIDTAYGLIGSYTSSGTVLYSTVTNGYRYGRSDTVDQTSVFTGGSTTTTRPNLKLTVLPIAQEALISVSPASLDFGDVAVGSTSTQQLLISNTGNADLDGSITTPVGFTVDLASRAGVVAGNPGISRNTLNFSIGSGQSESFDIDFSPSTSAMYTGDISISSNASNNPNLSVSVSGMSYYPPTISINGAPMEITLEPDETGTDSFTISNTGSQDLNYSISLAEIRGSQISNHKTGQDRSISGSTLNLDAGGYQAGTTLNWTFPASNASTDSEWLERIIISFPAGVTVNSATNFAGGSGGDLVPDITSGNGVSINWFGEDASGWGMIHGSETATTTVNVTIGSAFSGTMSLPWEMRGDIYGAEPHTLTGEIQLSEELTPLDWLSINPLSGTIPGGQSATITGSFSSLGKEPGTYNALLTINSNDPINPSLSVAASMLVEELLPLIEVSTTEIAFGQVNLNATATQNFTISNPGTVALTGNISTPTFLSVAAARQADTRANPLLLSAREALNGRNVISYSIPAGQTQEFTISFTPSELVDYYGVIYITHNADAPQKQIEIRGTGIQAILQWSPNSIEVNLPYGENDSVPIDLLNLGNIPLTYTASKATVHSISRSMAATLLMEP
jgi:subtilisin family serine protease